LRIIRTDTLEPTSPLTRNEQDWVYNGLDVCVTFEIVDALLDQLDNVSRATYERSLALQGPILEMSTRGLRVDRQRRDEVLAMYRRNIQLVSEQLNEILRDGIGIDLNWRSPAQLKKLFYEVLGLPVIRKRNANGIMAPTTGRDALEQMQSYMVAEPICLHLLFLRDCDKKRMFLETGIDPDGRMRSSFNIAGTNTGRLASSMSDMGTGTNLQNVDRDLRSVFIADPGMKFGNLDLEQADARNVGALCWTYFVEKHGPTFAGGYLDACESGDLHTATCKLAWTNLPWTGDTKGDRAIADILAYRQDSYRQLAKKLGHGTNYYGKPRTMAKHTKTAVELIEDFQKRYFAGFPCIKEWHEHIKAMLKDEGQITTLFGRRRCFFGRPTEDSTLREAIAYAPQSMTADEINEGMLNLFRTNRVQLLVQVHDSLLFQYPEEEEDEIIPMALEKLRVPLVLARGREFAVPVDAKTGWNWGDTTFWSKDDFKSGLCPEDKINTAKENAEGLVKWKGHDKRVRETNLKLSLTQLLLRP
jgi:DNA polymerase I